MAPHDAQPADPIGRCHFCGSGLWAEDDYVQPSGLMYHRDCAERLISELEAAL